MLGKTHADVVQMFQSIPVNQYVDMVLCRGYPLPEDTNSSEEGTGEIITAMPGMDGQPIHSDGTPSVQDLHYMTTDGRHPAAAMPNGRYPEVGETTLLQPELVSMPLVKGPSGFGFAIADCPLGQKVKMILDAQWCRGLLKGDVIKEINRQNVQTLTHAQVVDILKDLPMGTEVNVLVLRGGEWWRESDLGSNYLLFILTTSHCRAHLALYIFLLMYGLCYWPRYNYLKIWNLSVQRNPNIEKIPFKIVKMKSLAMNIANQKEVLIYLQ